MKTLLSKPKQEKHKDTTPELLGEKLVYRYGKPFHYFKLGKSFSEGRTFMGHLGKSAKAFMTQAKRKNALIKVNQCPICGSRKSGPFLTRYGFNYRLCASGSCRHVFVANIINDKVRSSFFKKDFQYDNKNYCNPKISKFRLEEIAIPKVDFTMQFTSPSADSWLDVGCGSGEILAALNSKKWSSVGLDLGGENVKFAKANYGLDIKQKTLEEFIDETRDHFDVISFFGVIHCVRDPGILIRRAVSVLKPGGIVVVEIPHHESIESSAVKSFPDHPSRSCYNGISTLHHFTRHSAHRLFTQSGLIPEAVWFLGTDVYEILNQLCYASKQFVDSPLFGELIELANELQLVIDQKKRSSNMIWIARKA